MSAPHGAPEPVTRYLDAAVACLQTFVTESGLRLEAYEIDAPSAGTWGHHLYGAFHDRDVAIQVFVHQDDAPEYLGTVRTYFRHYLKNGEVEWVAFSMRYPDGLAELADAVGDLCHELRLACLIRLPHPTDPDLKA